MKIIIGNHTLKSSNEKFRDVLIFSEESGPGFIISFDINRDATGSIAVDYENIAANVDFYRSEKDDESERTEIVCEK